jgi:hypothetical protein
MPKDGKKERKSKSSGGKKEKKVKVSVLYEVTIKGTAQVAVTHEISYSGTSPPLKNNSRN